ncbi:xanthine dehydrogenase family protein molybdopterin-binding subunit [Actinomadura citrea]|uniref:xanthine dehydrogenase family protein molybdopterin-binding subunit n=1 Tax=Actinomadura citrea TaxID=46158 RepID=UPI003CE4C7BE
MSGAVGREVARVDGREKVTGTARYSGEFALPDLAYAQIVGARVASGRVTSIDTTAAEEAGGVAAILTRSDLPRVARVPLVPSLLGAPAPGETFFPMQDDVVHYAGQPVAIVVADSLEQAQHVAALVQVEYAETPSVTVIEQGRADAYEPEKIFGGFMPAQLRRGNLEEGFSAADVHVDTTFRFSPNHHNALEPLTTTAVWEGDRLTLYDSCQGIKAVQLTVAALLGLSPSKIRVLTRFVGGAFGSKAMVWPHVTLAALAARHVRRPVRLTVTREQMFTSCGHREEQEQQVRLGARRDGTLTAIRHHKISVTSPFDDWAEPAFGAASQVYASPAFEGVHRLVRGNTMTPTFTRGPGESAGMFSLECAMDELACELGIDPVELRMRNLTDVDPNTGHPWSSGGLAECLRRGAQRFGWDGRDPRPGVRREGNQLIGTGMAVAAYPVAFFMRTQRARARLYPDCTAVVSTAAQEFGTGMTTVLTQVAADGLGIDLEDVRLDYGDTDMPTAGSPVGSNGAMMVSAAVHDAAIAVRDQMTAAAVGDPRSPLHGADPAGITVTGGRMSVADGTGETYGDLMERQMMNDAEAVGSWDPPPLDTPHGLLTFGAQFAEVAVDADLGLVRVRRMTAAFAPGRVLNPMTARSQLMGGMLWGMSQALLEGTRMDTGLGRWANASLGDYLVPVNADAPDIEIELIEVDDQVTGPLGVKGVGEIGQVGSGGAIANAVHHATGHRVRELPISAEHLLAHLPVPDA